MKKSKLFSIISIICFVSVLLIPIGIAFMWLFTEWKKILKGIISGILAVLYVGLIVLFLMLEPSYNTSGVVLPVNYGKGTTAFETEISVGEDEKKSDKENTAKSKKKTDKQKEMEEEQLPRSMKKGNGGRNLSRTMLVILFFLFLLILIIIQNMRFKKNVAYENPYVDTNKYKLPLEEDAHIPMVHYLRLKLRPDEKLLYATETIKKGDEGDFVVTNQRVVIFGKEENSEFPLEALTAITSISSTVISMTSGERKYYIFMPESQLRYALAIVRWAYQKIAG